MTALLLDTHTHMYNYESVWQCNVCVCNCKRRHARRDLEAGVAEDVVVVTPEDARALLELPLQE